MIRHTAARCAIAATALAFAPLSAAAQTVSAGGLLQRYTFAEPDAASVESLTVIALPFAARAPLGNPRLALTVNGMWARGTLQDPTRGELSISGLADTQVALTASGRGGATSVTLIALAPTGNPTQNLDESRVAGAVASELLPFALSNWGTGGGFGVSAATAHRLGTIGVGLSASYLVRQEFEPLADRTFAYRPGDVLRLVGAIDATVGAASKAQLQVAWHHHADDSDIDEANLFRAGDRLQVMGSLGFPVNRTSTGLVYAALHHRASGSYLASPETVASRDLLLLGGGLRYRLGSGTVALPRVEGRLFRRDDGIEQGWDLGVGLDLEVDVAGTVWVPTVRAHLGDLEVREGVSTGFTGFEAGLTLRFGGGA
ncbi:hypothetical protein [Gaopeijia maritima]|uniref:Autotransporter domain-containing protein n=1 Tax=Gaopeijia maritima TaxID=3119007 RepID=A0ABU9EBR4_9BACT